MRFKPERLIQNTLLFAIAAGAGVCAYSEYQSGQVLNLSLNKLEEALDKSVSVEEKAKQLVDFYVAGDENNPLVCAFNNQLKISPCELKKTLKMYLFKNYRDIPDDQVRQVLMPVLKEKKEKTVAYVELERLNKMESYLQKHLFFLGKNKNQLKSQNTRS